MAFFKKKPKKTPDALREVPITSAESQGTPSPDSATETPFVQTETTPPDAPAIESAPVLPTTPNVPAGASNPFAPTDAPSKIPDILLEAPIRPTKKQMMEYLERAMDEIPNDVAQVLRFWNDENSEVLPSDVETSSAEPANPAEA